MAHPRRRRVAAWAIVIATVPVATGWLYLLRNLGPLDVGPSVRGALPLQQLAGSDDQPLLRLLVVWLPAGALGASALAWSGRRRPVRVAGPAVVALVVLLLVGAVSDAAAISDPVTSHLGAQVTRSGTLVATALVALGAAGTVARRAGGVVHR